MCRFWSWLMTVIHPGGKSEQSLLLLILPVVEVTLWLSRNLTNPSFRLVVLCEGIIYVGRGLFQEFNPFRKSHISRRTRPTYYSPFCNTILGWAATRRWPWESHLAPPVKICHFLVQHFLFRLIRRSVRHNGYSSPVSGNDWLNRIAGGAGSLKLYLKPIVGQNHYAFYRLRVQLQLLFITIQKGKIHHHWFMQHSVW